MVIPNSMSQAPSHTFWVDRDDVQELTFLKALANTQNQRFVLLGTDGTVRRTMKSFSARSVWEAGTGHARTDISLFLSNWQQYTKVKTTSLK